jgi:Ecdysteroid kinase-like family
MHGYGVSSGRLNIDGTKFVASKLAKFHAASLYLDSEVFSTFSSKLPTIIYQNFQGKGLQYYQNGLFNLKSRNGINFMKNNMNLFIDEIKTWEGFEMIAEKMESVVGRFEMNGEKVYQVSEGFSVLNHGDFCISNMMFKNDSEGKISDVLFVS